MANNRETRSAKDLWRLYGNDEVEKVDEDVDTQGGDHTQLVTTTVKDAEGRYWQGTYSVSPGSDYNEWREGYAVDFTEVFPKIITTTIYE